MTTGQRHSLMSQYILFDYGFVEMQHSLITRIISKEYKWVSTLESLRHTKTWKIVIEALSTGWLTEKWESMNVEYLGSSFHRETQSADVKQENCSFL